MRTTTKIKKIGPSILAAVLLDGVPFGKFPRKSAGARTRVLLAAVESAVASSLKGGACAEISTEAGGKTIFISVRTQPTPPTPKS